VIPSPLIFYRRIKYVYFFSKPIDIYALKAYNSKCKEDSR